MLIFVRLSWLRMEIPTNYGCDIYFISISSIRSHRLPNTELRYMIHVSLTISYRIHTIVTLMVLFYFESNRINWVVYRNRNSWKDKCHSILGTKYHKTRNNKPFEKKKKKWGQNKCSLLKPFEISLKTPYYFILDITLYGVSVYTPIPKILYLLLIFYLQVIEIHDISWILYLGLIQKPMMRVSSTI